MSDDAYTLNSDDLLIIKAVAETLYMASEWGPNEHGLASTARQVAEHDVQLWTSCPVCDESVCDDGCPLHGIRLRMKMW